MNNPPEILVVEFDIKPEYVDIFATAIELNARTSLAVEPGCRQFDIARDPLRRTLFFLYEVYENEQAIDAHLQSAHFLEMNQLTAPWVAAKTVRRLQRTVLGNCAHAARQ